MDNPTPDDLNYEVLQANDAPSEWLVEAINYSGDGEVFMARFSGPSAQRRAEEYAAWKNAPTHDKSATA